MNLLHNDLEHILTHTDGLWDELRDANIFITGGTGFFGCWLLESFLWINDQLQLDAKVHVLARNFEKFHKKAPHLAGDPALVFHAGDVRTFDFPEGEFPYVIHAATEASAKLNTEQPELMYNTVLEGTEHVLSFAKHCGAKKLLFTSSGAVYGRQPPELYGIPETYAGNAEHDEIPSPYAVSKLAAEKCCEEFAQTNDCEIKIARCFAFVGPYLPLDMHFAIGNFILAGLEHKPIQISGDGTPYRSYLYAADLIIWLWHILLRGENLRPYNVGSEQAINIADLAHLVAQQFDSAPEIIIAKQPDPDIKPARYVPDIQRAKKELALDQWIDLSTAIEKTKQWHLKK